MKLATAPAFALLLVSLPVFLIRAQSAAEGAQDDIQEENEQVWESLDEKERIELRKRFERFERMNDQERRVLLLRHEKLKDMYSEILETWEPSNDRVSRLDRRKRLRASVRQKLAGTFQELKLSLIHI